MPRRFGFGLGFSLSRLTGAIREPSGFVAKYLSYIVSSMSLVTGDNVEQWDDQSENNNDLTQATSANQPVLVEQDVVKQSTLANMPTLVDTGGGVLAMDFADPSTTKYLQNTGGFSGKSYLIKVNIPSGETTGSEIISHSSTGAHVRIQPTSSMRIDDDIGTRITNGTSTTINFDVDQTIIFTIIDGVSQNISVEGSAYEVLTTSPSSTFTFDLIGTIDNANRVKGYIKDFKVYNTPIADPTNITETPDFELLPQTQYLLNDTGVEASAGDLISTWYTPNYSIYNNVVRFDATNDNMTPLPTTTGNFAMQFKKKANTLATTKVLFSSSTTSAEVRLNTSNQFEVVSDGGTVFTFTTTLVTSQQEINIVQRNGNDLEVYDSIGTKQVLDVTGEAFTFDRVSDTANASDSDWQEIRIYDKALSQSSIDYFYYLRDANNEILLPPLLPS